MRRLGSVTVRVIGVFWPGDNWSSGAYYMQAVDKVGAIARRFARDIHDAAVGRGEMQISFVAHSLGSRLVLETLRELAKLLKTQPVAGLKVRRIVFMAGAVPVSYLEPKRPLHGAVREFGVATKSLHSTADRVLQFAFPSGQTLTGEGFFPTALGRTHWRGAGDVSPQMEQTENPKAGHSDYWGSESTNAKSLALAAAEARAFIPFGRPPPPRATPVR